MTHSIGSGMEVNFVASVLRRAFLARLLASFPCDEEVCSGLGDKPVEQNRSWQRCGTSLLARRIHQENHRDTVEREHILHESIEGIPGRNFRY